MKPVRRHKMAKKPRAKVAPARMDEIATALTRAVADALQADADAADAARYSPRQRENARAVQEYLAEYDSHGKRVDALITELCDEIGKATNLESLILYACAQRLGISRLPAPSFRASATAHLADIVRTLRAGGTPVPMGQLQGTAERLKLIIEGDPLYQPGPDI